MNHVVPIPHDLIGLHRVAVVRTLVDLFKIPAVHGLLAEAAVDAAYALLTDDDRAMLLHQEPFDTACNMAGVDGAERQSLFERVAQTYAAMMEEIDDQADLFDTGAGTLRQPTTLSS